MKRLLSLLAVLCLVAGCGGDGEAGKTNGEEEGHGEEPRHGGKVVVLGADEAHVEMKVDHSTGTVELWFYDADMKDCKPDEAPVLNAKVAAGFVSLKASLDGDAWTIRDDSLKAEPEQARFQLKIGGKTYTSELAHDD